MERKLLGLLAWFCVVGCGRRIDVDAELRTGIYVVDYGPRAQATGCSIGIGHRPSVATPRVAVYARPSTLSVFVPQFFSETTAPRDLHRESQQVWFWEESGPGTLDTCRTTNEERYAEWSESDGTTTAIQTGDDSFDLLRNNRVVSVRWCASGAVERETDCEYDLEARYTLDEPCAAPCAIERADTLDPTCVCP